MSESYHILVHEMGTEDKEVLLDEACRRLDNMQPLVSSGFIQRNTSHLKWKSKIIPQDDSTSDDWLKTGKRSD